MPRSKIEPVDKDLYEKVKKEADEKYTKPSAYKSGWIVKRYKELGGEYTGKKPKETGLARWFKEEWEDIGDKDYPVYRPKKRITKDTPLTKQEIDPKNLKEQVKLKQKLKGDKNLPPFKEKEGAGLPAGDIQKLLEKSYDKKTSDYGKYQVDKKLSGQRVQVYYNPEIDRAIVVHRGTASIQDWGTNLAMSFGLKGKRFNHAKKIQDEAEAKYGKDKIITMGHSQGGRWAEKLGRDTSEVITLNKPTLPEDLIKGDKVPKNQTDIKTGLDPVSALRGLQKGNETLHIKSPNFANPILEHSVAVMERIPEDRVIGIETEQPQELETQLKVGEGLYKILPYTLKQAKKLGVVVKPSKKKGKKIDVFKDGKLVASVGGAGYKDFPTFWKTEGKAVADKKRKLYKARHEKDRHKEGSAGYYADKLLW
jgi:hypothetical protein